MNFTRRHKKGTMTKYKDFIPHTRYKYSILKYCNRNTIYRKISNLMIYRYIVIIWCIIEPSSLQAQQTLSVPIYRNLQSYSEMKLSADTGFYKTNLSAGNIMIPVHGVDTWEKKQSRRLHWNLKTNILYAATSTPNLGLEISWGTRLSFNMTGGYNPWNRKGTKGDNDKIVHWLMQPELRYWFCEPMAGHFISIHVIATQYNIGGHKFFRIFDSDHRYEGWGIGGGFSYGYSWILSKRWSIESYLGFGITQLNFDRFNGKYWCCSKSEHAKRTYFGPTQIGISLVYCIK